MREHRTVSVLCHQLSGWQPLRTAENDYRWDDQMYVAVKELSPAVRDALASVRYGAADIQVIAATEVEPMVAGGSGKRGFVTVINLDSGARSNVRGSWGGAAIAAPANPVDLDSGKFPIPPNGAVIKGTTGYPRTFATLYAHPDAMGRFLPSGETESTTDAEQLALYCHVCVKGGQYRRDEMRRYNVTSETVDALVSRGLIKRNAAGATQITTAGRNAFDRSRARGLGAI